MIDIDNDSFEGAVIASLTECYGVFNMKRLTDKQINRKFRKIMKKFKVDHQATFYQRAQSIIKEFDYIWPDRINFAVYVDDNDNFIKDTSIILLTEDENGTKRQEFNPRYNPLFIKMPATIESCSERYIITNKDQFKEENPWHEKAEWDENEATDNEEELQQYLKEIKKHYEKRA